MDRRAVGSIQNNGVEVAQTHQCPHCSGHFQTQRGSGKARGFCMNCGRLTCDKPGCVQCVPFLKRLEAIEKKATRDMRLGFGN
jgi:hypothetical protein